MSNWVWKGSFPMAQSFTSKDRVRLNTLCLRIIFFNTRFHYLKTVTLIIKRFSECVDVSAGKGQTNNDACDSQCLRQLCIKSDMFVYDNTTLALKHFRKPFVVANYMLCMCLVSRVNSCVAHPVRTRGHWGNHGDDLVFIWESPVIR